MSMDSYHAVRSHAWIVNGFYTNPDDFSLIAADAMAECESCGVESTVGKVESVRPCANASKWEQ